ncbi:Crp/Fnr family transcriptional regulator [Flavobacterium filum]|uniref:Crp/Fnr family transcriptional regulator n=1 Tax=Flavobacterium TaxID=237 RepID=UPI001AC2B864|nr:Crp/Fnr family transcriptional regulator [Flavobacterium filum]MBN8567433.1 Crp/Fnr family transcriptional regulator [Flavobacteriales bacterium]
MKSILAYFDHDLLNTFEKEGILKAVPKDTELIRDGQYINSIPIVISGLVKVFTKYNEKEFLLYYIQPSESCVLSFIVSKKNEPSTFFAKTEEDSEILLLPAHKVQDWIKKYPSFNAMYFNLFNERYFDLINTLNHVLFDRLDARLYAYLKEKKELLNSPVISLSHKDIAFEMGTSREVITRVLKKLEAESKVLQSSKGIEIL